MYMITKMLYIANAVIQIFLLNAILGDGYTNFGYASVRDLTKGLDWQTSPVFPQITICSFEIRRLGQNIHRYTVQCLLSVNLFNEKVYMVIWWWLLLVAVLSTLGLILWLFTATSSSSQRAYTKKYLKIMGRYHKDHDVAHFVEHFLRLDGVFTLRQIGKNTNDAVVGEVMAALWDRYMDTRKTFSPMEEERV